MIWKQFEIKGLKPFMYAENVVAHWFSKKQIFNRKLVKIAKNSNAMIKFKHKIVV
jgi:hypothetical protein